jgi:hypothetical protein
MPLNMIQSLFSSASDVNSIVVECLADFVPPGLLTTSHYQRYNFAPPYSNSSWFLLAMRAPFYICVP